MKLKKCLSLFLALIFSLTCFPFISAAADELEDGQIIADGVYYIQNMYSEYYMQMSGIYSAYTRRVCHMDKNHGDEIVDDPYFLSLEYDVRYMWIVEYLGYGRYKLSPMANLNFELGLDTSTNSATYVTLTEPYTYYSRVWSIEADENGYYIYQHGDNSKTIYAPKMDRSANPCLITSNYNENTLNCHWRFIEVDPHLFLYDSNNVFNPDITIKASVGDVLTLNDMGLTMQMCPIRNNYSITWRSSNSDIVEVDQYSGTITCKGFGTVTIRAVDIIDDVWCEVQYTVNVSLASKPHNISSAETGQYLSSLSSAIMDGDAVATSPLSDGITERWFSQHLDDYWLFYLEIDDTRYYISRDPYPSTSETDIIFNTEVTEYSKWILHQEQDFTYRISTYTWFSTTQYLSLVYNNSGQLELTLCAEDEADYNTWHLSVLPYIDLQVYYDSYVSAYSTSEHTGIENIEAQIETLKNTYWEYFGITVNIYGPTYLSTYIDKCPTYATTGVCNCSDCTNLLNNDTSQQYHHTSFANILGHLPKHQLYIDAVVLFIGHPACGISDNNNHVSQYALGVTYPYYNILCINNIGTYENGAYQYNHQDCTKTLVHEIGHLFFAPDHYGDPSTDDINASGDYEAIFDPLCIYGESRSYAAAKLDICDGCSFEICKNRDRYIH